MTPKEEAQRELRRRRAKAELERRRATPSVGSDLIKAIPSALARGTADVVGLPGTIGDALKSGGEWALRKGYEGVTGSEPSPQGGVVERFFAGPTPEVEAQMIGGGDSPVSGATMRQLASALTGGRTDYKAKTTPGKFASTISEFIPGAAAFGAASIPGLIRNAVVPGAMSEGAGQLAHEYAPGLEPYARIAAALIGGFAGNNVGGGSVKAPSAKDIKAESSAIYEGAKPALKDAKLSQEVYERLMTSLGSHADDFGLVPEITGPVSNVLTREAAKGGKEIMPGVLDASKQPSLYDLELMRRSLSTAGGDMSKPAAGTLSGQLIDKLDEGVDSVKASDLIAGDADEAGTALETLTKARATWQTGKKAELVDRAMYKAKNAAGGYEAGLRNEFRTLLHDKKLANTFTDAERKAMETVVRGTFGSNALRLLGNLGFPIDQGRNFLGGSIGSTAGATIGSAIGGPVGGIIGGGALPALGTAARVGASNMTDKAASLVEALIKAGPEVGKKYQTAIAAQEQARQLAMARALIQSQEAGRAGQ